MKLKDTSLSRIEMEEKLVMQGYPDDMVAQAVGDVLLERGKAVKKKNQNRVYYGMLLMGLGLMVGVGSYVFFDFFFILPMGFMGVGLVYLLVGLFSKA